jgi:flagellar motor switch protein FliG
VTAAAVLQLPVPDLAPAPAPTPNYELTRRLTGRQKAAILVLQLGREESAKVLGKLNELELEELSAEIARMGGVPSDVSAAVVEEFTTALSDDDESGAHGGFASARELLIRALGPERAAAIIDRLESSMVETPFAFMQHLDSRQIVSFLADEHPQTTALVLAHLPAGLASQVLSGLGRELQADVAHRIAVMDRTSPELIRQVEAALERRLSSLGVASDLSAVGGLKPLIEIINRSDRATEKMILEGLAQTDPELAQKVRDQMFMFEDVAGLDDRAIQLVVRQVQTNDLATALKGVADSVRAKFMQNMSERAALTLAEEIDMLGPVRLQVVEEAQAGIIRVVRELEENGEIFIGRGDEDAFVA